MPGLLRLSKVAEGPASPFWCEARTPFALMQQCLRDRDTKLTSLDVVFAAETSKQSGFLPEHHGELLRRTIRSRVARCSPRSRWRILGRSEDQKAPETPGVSELHQPVELTLEDRRLLH